MKIRPEGTAPELDALEPEIAAMQAKIDAEQDPRVRAELEEDKEDLLAYIEGMAAYKANPVTYTHEEVVKELGIERLVDSCVADLGFEGLNCTEENKAAMRRIASGETTLEAELDALDEKYKE